MHLLCLKKCIVIYLFIYLLLLCVCIKIIIFVTKISSSNAEKSSFVPRNLVTSETEIIEILIETHFIK